MDRLEDGESVKSPLLGDISSNVKLDELGQKLEDDFNAAKRGINNYNIVKPVVFGIYSFQDAVDPDQENKWLMSTILYSDKERGVLDKSIEELGNELDDSRFNLTVAKGKTKNSIGDDYDIELIIGDIEDRNNQVKLVYDSNLEVVHQSRLEDELENLHEEAPSNDSGSSYSDQFEVNGREVNVTPDLETGWFDLEDASTPSYNSRIWVPMMRKDEALLIEGSNDRLHSDRITLDSSRTGDLFKDTMIDALDKYAPYWGIPRPEIEGAAIDYFCDSLVNQPRDVRIRQNAWSKLNQNDYDVGRVRDNIFTLAYRDEPTGLFSVEKDRLYQIDQIGSENSYMEFFVNSDDALVVEDLHPSKKDASFGDYSRT